MNHRPLSLLLMVCTAVTAGAQSGSLVGRVIDARTLEPLPFANIFINNTTLGVAADAEGQFTLRDVPPGTHDVVFSFVGYESYQAKFTVREGEARRVNIKLMESERVLDEVAIRESRDKTWEKQLKKFERIFLGDNDFGKKCRITNPWVIDLQTDDQKKFTAKASVPVEIMNDALGYKLSFHLKDFNTDGATYAIIGNVRFEELQPEDASTALLWTMNRKTAYNRSIRHFFKSLIDQKYAADGYRIYQDAPSGVPFRSHSFATELIENVKEFEPNGIVTAGNTVYEFKIQIKQRLEVHYLNEPTRSFFYKDVGHSVSWLESKSEFVRVTPDGVLINPKELVISGDMSLARVSEMLPFDYKPGKVVSIKPSSRQLQAARYQEKVHLHTSKPYYYPGEIVWIRAYMGYRDVTKKDTLSGVLHVALYNPGLEVIETRVIRLDSLPYAQFKLPLTLEPGLYSLRAHTNWMLNFGESEFALALPVLDPFEKMIPSPGGTAKKSDFVQIQTDKDEYGLREPVSVSVALSDAEGNPLTAELSAAVIDVRQVAPVKWTPLITKSLDFSGEATFDNKFTHRVEHGLTAYGEYVDDRKKPVKGELTFVKGNFEGLYSTTTDAAGRFQLVDLNFYDSVTMAIQAKKKGSVTFTPRPEKLSGFRPAEYEYKTEKQPTLQRIVSTYEIPSDATLLKEVTVTATRIEEKNPIVNVYGKPEKVFTTEELSRYGVNLGVLLSSMMPGYSFGFERDHWIFVRNRSQIASGNQFQSGTAPMGFESSRAPVQQAIPSEPILMIDNILFITGAETVGDKLQSINASMVERVEVNSLVGSMTGAAGAAGVINIAMKKAHAVSYVPAFQFVTLKGFDTPLAFHGPDYAAPKDEHSKPDYRSTLYWCPTLKADTTGHSTFSFYTSDLPGMYLITIEGMLPTGIPVHAEHRVEVINK